MVIIYTKKKQLRDLDTFNYLWSVKTYDNKH